MMRWKLVTAVAALVLLAAAAIVWHNRVAADFWPPDASRIGPNLVASIVQAAVVLIVAVLVWPPARRRLVRFVESRTRPLHDRLEQLHTQRQAHHEEQMTKLEAIHDHLRGRP